MPPAYYIICYGGVFLGIYRIKGGNRLYGDVAVSGAKNAVLPILAASVMTKGENRFDACPDISDVSSMLKILKALGCRTKQEGSEIMVDASSICEWRIPSYLMKEMRSSVFLAGSLLSRFGEAVISHPGGCNIGRRPIDIHIKGLRQLGAQIETREDAIVIKAGNMKPAFIRLDYPSVGATENILLTAVSIKGETVIENSAREPEIKDLQDYINKCGGDVKGAGSGTIIVNGGKPLSGCYHRIIPDRIEAGTFALMAASSGGKIFLKGAFADDIQPLLKLLEEAGCRIEKNYKGVIVEASGRESIKTHVKTAPYPGFPTDLHPQLVAFLSVKGAGSSVEENIFESRMSYAKQLIKMGADIEISDKKVIIKNNNILYGTNVEAEDLRGGAALVVAGLSADGTTIIHNTKYIKRGYGGLEEKIRLIGGEISEYE